ncbi:hypothetical protein [Rubellimicrobium mesophilum]|uniref:hypothetical protein n=1 Tax=Rubellimicrobium mesophilum TaxID=1123067 RepID=UPI000566CD98|nr:hypothetical protein [Rubellimicrobium mesophilum]
MTRVLALTLATNGARVYINPSHVSCFFEEGAFTKLYVIGVDNSGFMKVREGATVIAEMIGFDAV